MFNVWVNTRSSMLAEDLTTTGNRSTNKYTHSPYLSFQLNLSAAQLHFFTAGSQFPAFLHFLRQPQIFSVCWQERGSNGGVLRTVVACPLRLGRSQNLPAPSLSLDFTLRSPTEKPEKNSVADRDTPPRLLQKSSGGYYLITPKYELLPTWAEQETRT